MFQTRFVGNPEDRFSHDEAQMTSVVSVGRRQPSLVKC